MAIQVMVPQEGSMATGLILQWYFQQGDQVQLGDLLCEVETDKAAFAIEAPGNGTLLEILYAEGTEVPVLTPIAIVGQPGEDYSALLPSVRAGELLPEQAVDHGVTAELATQSITHPDENPANAKPGISPRARKLALENGIPLFCLIGSGPGGNIVERDIVTWLAHNQPLTPVAKEYVEASGVIPPSIGTGIGGRVTLADVAALSPATTICAQPLPTVLVQATDEITEIPVSGIRKVIADKMLASLQTTAQLTLHSSATAGKLLELRERLKNSPVELAVRDVTINDLVLYAVSRTLGHFTELNSHFMGDEILVFKSVHLAFAVNTSKGLFVPVIRNAHTLSLKALAGEAKRLTEACRSGQVNPNELQGGTFTVSNLGSMGIRGFTPILNPPQVGILGVGCIDLKPIRLQGEVVFQDQLELSLTLNHQAIDGAPAALFLKALTENLANIDLLLVL